MKTEMYTHYDMIAQQCEGVLHARNEGDAIRQFMKRFENRKDGDEFALLHLGSMEHDTGQIYLLDVPEEVPIATPEAKQFGGNNSNGSISDG